MSWDSEDDMSTSDDSTSDDSTSDDSTSDDSTSDDSTSDDSSSDDSTYDSSLSGPRDDEAAKKVVVTKGRSRTHLSDVLARYEGEYTFGDKATMLPAVPGLHVEGVGCIPLPLTEHYAQKLMAAGSRSPSGKQADSQTDIAVRSSYQVDPSRVTIHNPQWTSGLEQLSAKISERMAYENCPLELSLYKVLIYESGGHIARHSDSEKEDGMVALLAIQLPSVHEGGDLIVFKGRRPIKYDFGKSTKQSAFAPHYVVRSAAAKHELTQVTSGHRLVLVYSACLPADMRHLERKFDVSLKSDLSRAINSVSKRSRKFTLAFTHSYAESGMSAGIGGLETFDRARVRALVGANKMLKRDKQLQFHLAELEHKVEYDHDEETLRKEYVSAWYDVDGRTLRVHGLNNRTKAKRFALNFLNPDAVTLADLWGKDGVRTHYQLDRRGASMSKTYVRHGLIAWPACKSVEYALKFIDESACLLDMKQYTPLTARAVKSFVKAVADKRPVIMHETAEWFLQVVTQLGNRKLWKTFCATVIPRVSRETRRRLSVRIGRAFCCFPVEKSQAALAAGLRKCHGDLEFLLRLIKYVPSGGPEIMVASAIADEALAAETITSDYNEEVLKLLWKRLVACSDHSPFGRVARHFAESEPSKLGGVIRSFAHFPPATPGFVAFQNIVAARIAYLEEALGPRREFSWEMPQATLLERAALAQMCSVHEIEEFLRGPQQTMCFGTSGLPMARQFARTLQLACQNTNASFHAEPTGRGKDACVRVTKTRDYFFRGEQKRSEEGAAIDILRAKFFPPAGTADDLAPSISYSEEIEPLEIDVDKCACGDEEESEACEDENDRIGDSHADGVACEAADGALDKVGDDESSNKRAREADNDGIDNSNGDGESCKKTAREAAREAANGALDKVGDDEFSNKRAREADNDGIDNSTDADESSKKRTRAAQD